MDFLWVKALHVIAVIAWLAGMLYLPRLYVYHCAAPLGSEQDKTFQVMERRLLRLIINPAMIAAWVFGIWMLALNPVLLHSPSMHVKLGAVLLMQIVHAFCARCRRDFERGQNKYPARVYRIANEVPAVLMVLIVIMVIVKPFG